MRIKKVSIFDLDGTVICSRHRYRTTIGADGVERIDLQHWRDNEHLAYLDSLLPLAQQYRADLQDEETFVIVATARVMREADMAYLRDVLGAPDYLISRRGEDDRRGGAQLKIAGLAKFFNLKPFRDAEFVLYEDNVSYLKTICDRFRIRGVYVPSAQGH